MTDVEQPIPTTQESGLAALPVRVVQVLVSPGRLFADLRNQPKSLGAILLGGILVGLSNGLIPTEIWEQVVRDQVAASGQELPDDLARPAQVAKWASTIGPLLFWPLLTVAVASVNSLVFLVGLGYEGRYSVYLSLCAHALLVGALGAAAMTPVRIFAEDVQLMLTVGAFLPELEAGLLSRMMRYLDLFNLWASGLIGLGASIIDGQRGAGVSIVYALAAALLVALSLAAAIG